MTKPSEIITDAEIERVHANANFGDTPRREVVNNALLKHSLGYHSGSTANHILADHNLIVSRHAKPCLSTLTSRGKEYLKATSKTGAQPKL